MKLETDITPELAAFIFASLYVSTGLVGKVDINSMLKAADLLENIAKILGNPTKLDPITNELKKIMLEKKL